MSPADICFSDCKENDDNDVLLTTNEYKPSTNSLPSITSRFLKIDESCINLVAPINFKYPVILLTEFNICSTSGFTDLLLPSPYAIVIEPFIILQPMSESMLLNVTLSTPGHTFSLLLIIFSFLSNEHDSTHSLSQRTKCFGHPETILMKI